MKTKLISISILALLLFSMLACFTASALPPDPLVVATDPLDGEVGYMVSPGMSYLEADFSQLSGHPMMVRCGTNATGAFVWSNWVGPTTNDTINYPFNISLYEHTYYWTVWANDSYGNSSNTTFSFTTEGADPNITITYPVDGSTISTFTQITGTCDNASSIIFALLFDFDNSLYWNWAAGNWSANPLNYSTPIGVTSWIITLDMPTLTDGHSYGIAAYANNSYNTDVDSVGFTYQTHTHAFAGNGAYGVMAKLIVELVLVFIALAVCYFIITDYMHKKHATLKDMIEVFRNVVISLVFIGIIAAIIALL